jgi:predicted metal-binding membrane protein
VSCKQNLPNDEPDLQLSLGISYFYTDKFWYEGRMNKVLVDMAIEKTLRRDRLIVVIALAVVIVLSWVYILSGAGMDMSAFEMTRMNLSLDKSAGIAMMIPAKWTMGYVVMMFFMWWIMMIAMMLPSATPMILLFVRVNRKQQEKGNPYIPTGIFGLAYLMTWAAFSLIAVVLQAGFQHWAWLSPTLMSNSATLGALILLAAGIYQLTPIKQACLRYCRSPIHFILGHWREGTMGAFRMGVEHGVYCVGCCWFLMGLLFFGGVMNLYWIVGLACFVLLEKMAPVGHWISYATGFGLTGGGIWFLVQAW